MTNPTPIESAPGDFVCKLCELPGEEVRAGDTVGRCTRCERRTYRQLTGPGTESRSVQKRIAIMKGAPMPTKFTNERPAAPRFGPRTGGSGTRPTDREV